MRQGAPVTRLVAELPATVPFVGPEAIERRTGRPIRLRLGANESVFGPSPRAVEAMCAAAANTAYYADPESYDLRAAIADRLGVRMDEVVIGSGIDDLLGLVARAFVDRGETAVTSLGAYPTFNYHVNGFGGRLERVPYRNDRNDLDGLAEAAHRTGARVVFLANPDNPSGTFYPASDIAAFLDRLPDNCLLLLDEAYGEFAPPEVLPPMEPDDPRLLRVRTFSKAHGMAGARVGYAIGPAETIRTFEKVRQHFGVNLPAQAGALAALADDTHLHWVTTEVAKGRADYEQLAGELRLRALPSATNFVAIDVGSPDRAKALLAALTERDVFIRMPGAPPLDRCIRVTVGTPEQRQQFADIFREVWRARAE